MAQQQKQVYMVKPEIIEEIKINKALRYALYDVSDQADSTMQIMFRKNDEKLTMMRYLVIIQLYKKFDSVMDCIELVN